MEELSPKENKIAPMILLVEEKVSREYGLSLEDVKNSTITIKNGNISVKVKGKK